MTSPEPIKGLIIAPETTVVAGNYRLRDGGPVLLLAIVDLMPVAVAVQDNDFFTKAVAPGTIISISS